MRLNGRFPFGRPSNARPPRRPTSDAQAFVLGVYPSALHIRWRLPEWARGRFGWTRRAVSALAVDVEPEVFWDGSGQDSLLTCWKERVGWVEGDGPGGYGSCTPGPGNGSSGRAVVGRVLEPLGVGGDETWLTDCLPWFFIKSSASRPQQAEVINDFYAPIAQELNLEAAHLPARPTPDELVKVAVRHEGARLESEIEESRTGLVVTLGEEARRVMCSLAEEVGGSPGKVLTINPDYGRRGWLRVGGKRLDWYALTHPGNRSQRWNKIRDEWEARMRAGGA